MIHSLNAFADRQVRSYASAHNAQVAVDKKIYRMRDSTYSTAIIQRTDGRFAVVIINPDPDAMMYFVHCTAFGVWGVTV